MAVFSYFKARFVSVVAFAVTADSASFSTLSINQADI